MEFNPFTIGKEFGALGIIYYGCILAIGAVVVYIFKSFSEQKKTKVLIGIFFGLILVTGCLYFFMFGSLKRKNNELCDKIEKDLLAIRSHLGDKIARTKDSDSVAVLKAYRGVFDSYSKYSCDSILTIQDGIQKDIDFAKTHLTP